MEIEEKVDKLPASPGVYIMKGKGGTVLYIGKAKNLRSRVRSYFRKTGDGRYAVRFLASRAADIDCIVTTNEKEALFLEDTLLKQHKPKYNIRLKDSKTYVSIKITLKEKFPRILVTRQIKKDGSRYFGPYVSARTVRDTIKFIRRIFPLCVCSPSVFRNRARPCLDYQLGICSAPAVGLITEEKYRELVDGAIMFLEGKNRELVRTLKARMKDASARLDYEEAARFRDRIAAIEEMLEEQRVVTHRATDQDVAAFVREDGSISMQVLLVRDGRLVGSSGYFFDDTGLPDSEIVSSFLAQYYRGERYVPDEVIISTGIEDRALLAEWLTEKKGRKVRITVPVRGDKLKLVGMAVSNAEEEHRKKRETTAAKATAAEELKRRLHLSGTPDVIEAFDISNIGGSLAVGAMVCFRGGEPDKNSYRLFRIKGVKGPDDYAMMYEVLSRRYSGALKKGVEGDELPDLILMDGGKGQLNVALEVIRELGITGVDVAALAKERTEAELRMTRPGREPKSERVFLPGVKDPVILREGSRPDLLLRRIRDEVHRFAVTYHRKLRTKAMRSRIEDVKGIGERKKKALLERFGDLDGILAASVDELTEVEGITQKLAGEIKRLKKRRA